MCDRLAKIIFAICVFIPFGGFAQSLDPVPSEWRKPVSQACSIVLTPMNAVDCLVVTWRLRLYDRYKGFSPSYVERLIRRETYWSDLLRRDGPFVQPRGGPATVGSIARYYGSCKDDMADLDKFRITLKEHGIDTDLGVKICSDATAIYQLLAGRMPLYSECDLSPDALFNLDCLNSYFLPENSERLRKIWVDLAGTSDRNVLSGFDPNVNSTMQMQNLDTVIRRIR